jgi:hypothetical protein
MNNNFETIHRSTKIPLRFIQTYVEEVYPLSKHIISATTSDEQYEKILFKNLEKDPILVAHVDDFKEYADYSNVDELVKDKPEVIGECTLLLIWDCPTYYFSRDNIKQHYWCDIIKTLNPKYIIVYYVFDEYDLPYLDKKSEKMFLRHEKYGYLECHSTIYTHKHDRIRWSNVSYTETSQIRWLYRDDMNSPFSIDCEQLQKEADNISYAREIKKKGGCIIL